MEYTVNKLAKLAGVSARSIRYYDQIGLLRPARISSNGYRIYGEIQVDKLQQILFYKELGVKLENIEELMSAPDYNQKHALESHMRSLLERKEQLELLIQNVSKTIASMEGETKMSDKEKFEGFKKDMINENEAKYGSEIREKYGTETIEASNKKVAGMSQEQWQEVQELTIAYQQALKEAVKEGDPAGQKAMEACKLHKQWLQYYWKEGMYSPETHKDIVDMYVCDERFRAYYEDLATGCAEFFQQAVQNYYKN